MDKMRFFAVPLLAAALLAGCLPATSNTRTTIYYDQEGRPTRAVSEKFSDDAANYDSNARVAEADAGIIKDVLGLPCHGSELAQAYCQGGKQGVAIALAFKPQRVIARGPSLIDLGMHAIDGITGGMPWMFGIFAFDKLGDSAGRNNYVQADTVTDSFNPVEAHITGSQQASLLIDSSRPVTTNYAAKPLE